MKCIDYPHCRCDYVERLECEVADVDEVSRLQEQLRIADSEIERLQEEVMILRPYRTIVEGVR